MILVRLSPLQRALYTEFMTRFKEAGNTGWLSLNPLKAFCVCCKVRGSTRVSKQNTLDIFLRFLSQFGLYWMQMYKKDSRFFIFFFSFFFYLHS